MVLARKARIVKENTPESVRMSGGANIPVIGANVVVVNVDIPESISNKARRSFEIATFPAIL